MLREIRVRNFAVIDAVSAAFGPGLNVLTGETGAGKSMLIDAILLIRGARAQTDVIRTDTEAATVEAVFDVEPQGPAAAVLHDAGLGLDEGQLVVRRELTHSGRHRAFVNDSPVTVGLLERLGDHLVEVHGQHEHQRLLEPARQLELLDRFAGAEGLREQVAQLFAKYRAAREGVERMRAAERDRAQRQDLLRFQVSELDAARLRPGEEEELRAERMRLQHAERLGKGLAEASALLVDDQDAAASRLTRAARLFRDLGRLDPGFAAPADLLDAAAAHVEDVLVAVRALRASVDAEPGRLEAIDDRLDALIRLRRKYGGPAAAMLAFREVAARELERLEHHEEIVAAEERRVAELRSELLARAGALSEARRAAAGRLAALIQREVRALGMERGRLEIAIDPAGPDEVTARGLDCVELRFSANPGEELRPLARIASGGELSRTMLAVQAGVAAPHPLPTMGFCEGGAGLRGHPPRV